MTKLCVGDIVKGVGDFILACGSGIYKDAIIVSIDPLVAVSREGDMLWRSTITPDSFAVVGKASAYEAQHAFARWHNDQWQEKVVPLREAVYAATTDIEEWIQFGRRRREQSKQPDFDCSCPTEAGIDKSFEVIRAIRKAYGAFPRMTAK